MNGAKQRLDEALQKRISESRLRYLSTNHLSVDFCSNDYLGLARSEALKQNIAKECLQFPEYKNGSTGSRLLSGNTKYGEELEQWIADFHHAEAGLIFNSGYDANLGLFGSVTNRHDTFLYDELSHASIIDGIRLGLASSFKFEHNNLDDLEEKLKKANGNIFVAVESVYSMDGDFAPLRNLVILCEKYHANLLVDEAHATGLFGEKGRGRVCELELEEKVFSRVHTFGKAVGVHGAIVLGSKKLKEFLVNFARSFIYTTALPFHSLVSIKCAYNLMMDSDKERQQLKSFILHFYKKTLEITEMDFMKSSSPIQGIVIPGNDKVKSVAIRLQEEGFDVRPILNPTVPLGKERLRICLHSFNTKEEIDHLFQTIHSLSSSHFEEIRS